MTAQNAMMVPVLFIMTHVLPEAATMDHVTIQVVHVLKADGMDAILAGVIVHPEKSVATMNPVRQAAGMVVVMLIMVRFLQDVTVTQNTVMQQLPVFPVLFPQTV